MRHVSVRARVTMTVEIDVSDSWGGDCCMSQVHDQAVESATARLRQGGRSSPFPDFTIIGEPKVAAIIVEDER